MTPSAGTEERIEAAIREYPHPASALLAVLHLLQQERGHLTPEDEEYAAKKVGVPATHVAGVVSFYTMFRTRPMGRHHIQLCRTLSCQLRGSRELLGRLRQRLGIREGETTPDGRFSLVAVECLGSCGTAPMVQINDDYHENLSPDRLDALLDTLK
jgi:NADH-quinone oxidoreductase E subunit